MCVNKRLHSSVWFYARLITSYKQTAKPRNSDVEGTAQGYYLRGWGLSVLKRGTRHTDDDDADTIKVSYDHTRIV